MRRALFSMDKDPLILFICSILVLRAGSYFQMYLISTFCDRQSFQSYQESVSIFEEQLAMSLFNPPSCSYFRVASRYRRTIQLALARSCVSSDSILAISLEFCETNAEEDCCFLFSSDISLSQLIIFDSRAANLTSQLLMTSFNLVLSFSKVTSRLLFTSELMMRVVRLLLSSSSCSYLDFNSEQVCLSVLYSYFSKVLLSLELDSSPFSFHSLSNFDNLSISACIAFLYSFLLSFSLSMARVQSLRRAISFSHSS